MRISVKVKPNSKIKRIEKLSDNEFMLFIKVPPKEGKANKAVVDLLSEYLDLPKTNITIIKGLTSRNKVLDIKKER